MENKNATYYEYWKSPNSTGIFIKSETLDQTTQNPESLNGRRKWEPESNAELWLGNCNSTTATSYVFIILFIIGLFCLYIN